jgi:hypothetical protein
MSRFKFDITYIKGDLNKVADCLFRYYENDTVTNVHKPHEYVCADARIDPEGDDLPGPRFQEIISQMVELRAIWASERRQSQHIQDRINNHDLKALLMGEPDVGDHVIPDPEPGGESPNENAMLGDSLFQRESDEKPEDLEDNHFLQAIKIGYANDEFFKLIKEKLQEYNGFSLCEGLIWMMNPHGDPVVCILQDCGILTQLIDQAHTALSHFGTQHTTKYLRRWYWWPRMGKDLHEFCESCEACARAKGSTKKPMGKLHPLPIPTKPWDSIGMDFIGPFPESKGFNYLWVVICRMTSMVHLIPVHTKITAMELSWVYRREIVHLHGLPSSIVSDRDSKFTSK